MAINWELGIAPDIVGNALAAFEQGKQMRMERDTRNALGTLVTNPNDTAAFGNLAKNAPDVAMQFKQQQAEQQKAQREQHLQQVQTMSKLFGHAMRGPQQWQEAVQAAQQIGLDTSSIPQQYDPSWAGQQKLIADTFLKDGGQGMSGLAKELVDAGYKPGTPEFQSAMAQGINGKYGSDYVDEQGNVRRRSPLNIGGGQASAPQGAPQQPQQEPLTFDMYQGAVGAQGKAWADNWLKQNNLPIRVTTPQQAHSLPSGTAIILPDGSTGRVP